MKQSFNENWICYKTGDKENAFAVTLPHDAMQLDERSETSAGGVNTGWYEAQDYTYEKTFILPEKAKDEKVILEFEGVYRKATVYLNGEKVAYHSYGYLGFYVDATKYVKFGEENVIRVEVINHDQPNSRWYSGTGIYRPVWLYIVPKKHLRFDSVKITTLDYKEPKIRVEAWPNAAGEVKVEILEKQIVTRKAVAGESAGQTDETIEPCIDENAVQPTVQNSDKASDKIIALEILQADGKFSREIALPGANLWSPEAPNLYTCRVTFGEDIQEETFGIRVVSCTPEEGFCINGKRVLLKGGCIHHDNGLLGACAYEFAERRKIRILLDAGYNAIRSAHNPCSKALLRACDEMGMLVMDEYIDGWYIHKTKYDYADEILENYRKDLKDMVDKDYNHPSVIMYSTGNEVSETAQKKGIALTKSLTDRLHELDSTRPVSCGINIFFNFLSSMGFGVYSDKKADEAAYSFLLDLTSYALYHPKLTSPRVTLAKNYIDTHFYNVSLNLDEISDAVGLSKYHLCREFTHLYGTSPGKYLTNLRIQKSCILLLQNRYHTIGDIASMVGFSNDNYFCKVFRKSLGITPTQYRIQNQNYDLVRVLHDSHPCVPSDK